MGTTTKLLARAKNVRWLALYETARMVYGHGKRAWDKLEPYERENIGYLVRKSKGRRLGWRRRALRLRHHRRGSRAAARSTSRRHYIRLRRT